MRTLDVLGAVVLVMWGFWSLTKGEVAQATACLGWACALHNRETIAQIKDRLE